MNILGHWVTDIRKAITAHFMAVDQNVKIFVGESVTDVTGYREWCELKTFGPHFMEEDDGRGMNVTIQVRINCFVRAKANESIYSITDLIGKYAEYCNKIKVVGVVDSDFCLTRESLRTADRGFVDGQVALKCGYVECNFSGNIDAERVIL